MYKVNKDTNKASRCSFVHSRLNKKENTKPADKHSYYGNKYPGQEKGNIIESNVSRERGNFPLYSFQWRTLTLTRKPRNYIFSFLKEAHKPVIKLWTFMETL